MDQQRCQPSRSLADGVIVGNVYDKYTTRNPLARRLMAGFLQAATELYRRAAPRTVLEVGCGEGWLARHLVEQWPRPERFEACDLSLARVSGGLDPLIRFREASVYDLPYDRGEFDLIVCCEVLEHLDDPERALREMARVSRQAVLVSTPREPLWRVLNVLRGRYVLQGGNTPGHVQHFNRGSLRGLLQQHLTIVAERSPLPWIMALGAT